MSQYFELVLYLKEESKVATQWVDILNSVVDYGISGGGTKSNKAEGE